MSDWKDPEEAALDAIELVAVTFGAKIEKLESRIKELEAGEAWLLKSKGFNVVVATAKELEARATDVSALKGRLSRTQKLLRYVEWVDDHCLFCGKYRHDYKANAHIPGCTWAKLMEGEQK